MIKRAPIKDKNERETKPIRAYLTPEDYKEFVKAAKKSKCKSQSAFLRDIVLISIYGVVK